jgi:hypothetical protein
MKINASARHVEKIRHVVKIRDIMLVLLLATVFGLEVYLGASQAARICDTSALQTGSPATLSVSFSDVMSRKGVNP